MELLENNHMELAYKLFKRVNNNDFEYVYRGNFTQNITKSILDLAQINLRTGIAKSSIQKRVYFIMMEGMQNITRHQGLIGDKEIEMPGIFAIQKRGSNYYVTTGNLIKKENVVGLKSKLEQLNLLEPAQLKLLHKEILVSGHISNRGGAGLGLIEMARKSGRKLNFDFNEIDDNYSYFYFQTEILSNNDKKDFSVYPFPELDKNSVIDIKNLHNTLNSDDILANFNGNFNQKNILSLLSIIKSQINKTSTSKKLYNIMVEMLQNISKHADVIDDIPSEGKSGVFFLCRKTNQFMLTTGNYIKNNKIEILKEKIDNVNSKNTKQMSDYYNYILLKSGESDSKKTGLGFLDIRMKSDNKLIYSFRNINDNFSFYALQTSISLNK